MSELVYKSRDTLDQKFPFVIGHGVVIVSEGGSLLNEIGFKLKPRAFMQEEGKHVISVADNSIALFAVLVRNGVVYTQSLVAHTMHQCIHIRHRRIQEKLTEAIDLATEGLNKFLEAMGLVKQVLDAGKFDLFSLAPLSSVPQLSTEGQALIVQANDILTRVAREYQ